MRTSISVGMTNDFHVTVVGGPYPGLTRGNSTKWDFLCPFCNERFLAPTTRFKTSKSCYQCRGEVLKSFNESTTMDYLYHVIKGRKTSKEKGFGLTKEYFYKVSKQNCYYCDAPPTITNGYKEWHPKVRINGLDRIDPHVGYFDENVVACCKYCNVAKLDRTEEDFISWIERLSDRRELITSRFMSTQNSV